MYNEMGAKMPSDIAWSWPFGWKWYYSRVGFHRFIWSRSAWLDWQDHDVDVMIDEISQVSVYLTNIDVSVQYIPEIRLMETNKTSRFSEFKHDFCAGKLIQNIFYLKSFRENRKSFPEILSFWLVLTLRTWRRSSEQLMMKVCLWV